MVWPLVIAAVAAAGSQFYGGKASKRVAKKNAKKMDPFGKYRGFYGEELQDLWEDPSSIFEDPAFRAAYDLGEQSVARQMAASGFLDSGNMATELLRYGMGFGLDWTRDTRNFLAQLAGAQIPPNRNASMQAEIGGISDMMGSIGTLSSAFANMYGMGGFGNFGGSTGTFGGGFGGGSGGMFGGGGYGSIPFSQGSWDFLNMGGR